MSADRNQSPDSSIRDNRAPVQSVTLNLGGITLIAVVILAVIIGACGVAMGLNLAKQSQLDRDFRNLETAYKLEERRKMDLEAYMEVNGFKVPGDDSNGPTGNLRRMKPKEK